MAETDYNPVPGTVPEGFCPETWQEVLNQFSALQTITLTDASTVSVGTDAPANLDSLWIRTSVSEPYVVGAFVYQSGAWRRIPGHPLFFVDSGSANALAITTGESLNATTASGRIFLIRVASQNTGASTLAVDSMGSKALRKNNDTPLANGDIEAGQLILVAYDSTADQWELITTLPVETPDTVTWETTPTDDFPLSGQSVTLNHTRNKIPEFVRVVAVCNTATVNGYSRGDEIEITCIGTSVGPHYSCAVGIGDIEVSSNGVQAYYPTKGGGYGNWSTQVSSWKIKAYVLAFP